MRFVFFETPLFTQLLPAYLDDEQYRKLQRKADDLTADQCRLLKRAIRAELRARRGSQ
jgi:hypothetical protein